MGSQVQLQTRSIKFCVAKVPDSITTGHWALIISEAFDSKASYFITPTLILKVVLKPSHKMREVGGSK